MGEVVLNFWLFLINIFLSFVQFPKKKYPHMGIGIYEQILVWQSKQAGQILILK